MNIAWYVVRAGGVLGFVLLSFGVLLGLSLSARRAPARWPRFALEEVHRYVGLLTGAFVSIHVGGLLLDSYLGLGLADLVVPGLAPYRPFWTAVGVVALELMLALALTNHYRKRLPYAFWRRAHAVNFLVWSFVLLHGIAAGSDSDARWAVAVYVLAAGAVAGATAHRVAVTRRAAAWAVGLATGSAGIVAAELVLALTLGPLGRGLAG